CPASWVMFRRSCYKVVKTIANWTDARATCGKLGGDLVKIKGEEENKLLYNLSRKEAPSAPHMWIGLKRNPNDKKFYWVDGSKPGYTKWMKNEPNNAYGNENCGQLYSVPDNLPYFQQWNDYDCSRKCTFICEKSAFL
ncbi:predicted protein, partial [Nematostella vectensis]